MGGSGRQRSRKRAANTDMWNSKSKKKTSTDAIESTAVSLFQEILDGAAQQQLEEELDTEQLNMEGIALIGEKLGIDVETDLRIIVLLWKMNASKPGALTKTEFVEACKNGTLPVDNGWESIKEILPRLDIGFLTGSEFKDFYKFCFQFNRQGTHKTLDKELVVALLQMVLKDRVPSDRLDSFCDFLTSMEGKQEQQYSRITLDQWASFWDFCVECEDLSTYDQSCSAWPVLIDEYVEYMEEKLKK